MASEAAALLDQLMGRARNAVPGEDGAPSERCWSDEDVSDFLSSMYEKYPAAMLAGVCS